jgi:hypothetical protein
MPENLIMEKGKTYSVKITEIQNGKKQVGGKFRLFVLGHDLKGRTFKAEHLSPILPGITQPEDLIAVAQGAFTIGIPRIVKCWQVSELGTPTIDPYDEERIITPPAIQQGDKPPLRYMPNCHNANISGSSLAFATAYAKDILCSEIAANGRHQDITEVKDNDIERMLGWVDKINSFICDKVNYGAGGGSPV